MNRDCRRTGSLTVEASIVVPVVFVLILPFLYILRSVYIYHCVAGAMYETADLLSALLYLQEKLPEEDEESDTDTDDCFDTEAVEEALSSFSQLAVMLSEISGDSGADTLLGNLTMQQTAADLMDELLEEKHLEDYGLSGGEGGISYAGSDFFYEDLDKEGLFLFTAEYSLDFPFASSFASLPDVEITLIGRKYIGQETSGVSDSDEESEEEEETYYMIGNGDHYHISSCFLLDKETTTMTISEAIAAGYTACSKCDADQYTSVVVTEGGTRYHAADCYHVGGKATEISWDEIVENGYEPCEICIGGGTWFG